MSDLPNGTAMPGDAPPPQITGQAPAAQAAVPQTWQPPATAATRRFGFDLARWRPTGIVAGIIAVVVLGGVGLNGVIPAPSAGTQSIGGTVTITASPGWVLVSASGDTSQGLALQKGDATLTAQVLSQHYSGDSNSVMAQVRAQLQTQVAQISYGDEHATRIGSNDTTYVLFEAIASGSDGNSNQMGPVDGELICMIVSGNAVVLEVAAPQGDLQFVTDDVSTMVKTVRAAQ
jgi:hypothetical protein